MPDTMQLTMERDVPARMRDGTILHGDVYRPAASGPYPVILLRTPYNKSFGRLSYLQLDSMRTASQGYAVVIQDRRGRFNSEGEFYCFRHESDDGYATVEWAARQPWSDGNVGMYGVSYMGATQWLAALARPPDLKCMVPLVTASDYHEGWSYRGGAFALGFNAELDLDEPGADQPGPVQHPFNEHRLPPRQADRGGGWHVPTFRPPSFTRLSLAQGREPCPLL